jgi:polyferredoxin
MMFEDQPDHSKKKLILRIMLFLPLMLSVAWLVYIKFTEQTGPYGFLSPPVDNTPLIIGLVLFAAGYLIFLGLLFASDVKEWFEEWRENRAKE